MSNAQCEIVEYTGTKILIAWANICVIKASKLKQQSKGKRKSPSIAKVRTLVSLHHNHWVHQGLAKHFSLNHP